MVVAPNNRRPIPINTKKIILLSYLSYFSSPEGLFKTCVAMKFVDDDDDDYYYLFRFWLLFEDSYLLEGLQSADKTNVPKTKVTKRTHF